MGRLKPRQLFASEYDLRGLLTLNDSSDVAAAANRTLLQEAYDQLQLQSASGPSAVLQLPRGQIWIDRPIMVPNNSALQGVRGVGTTQIIPTYIGGPAFIVAQPDNASPEGTALLTGEDYSIDIRTASEGTGPDYVKRLFDYGGQLGIQPRNWTSLRIEFAYKLQSAPVDTATIWMCGGQRTSAEGYKVALWIGFLSGQLICDIRISAPGTDPALTVATRLAVPTTSTVGTTYYCCIDWNGTTAKLWHATPGTAMAAPVASSALSGVFSTRFYEVLVLGSAGYGFFPDPLPEQLSAAPAFVSGHIVSSVSKHQAAYTAPSAAFTPATDDWLTFVATNANKLALSANAPTAKNVYKVNMLGGKLGYHRLVRSTYNVLQYATIKDVTINGGGNLGGGVVGILASGAIDSHFERVYPLYCGQGIALQNNCYLTKLVGCDIIGGNFTWTGMPTNGQRCCRVGLTVGGASGVCVVSKFKIQGFGFGLASGYGSFEGESIWIIESYETKALFNQPSTMNMRSLLLADEGEAGFAAGLNTNDYALVVEIAGTGQALNFLGTSLECSNTLVNVIPIGLSGKEYRTQVAFRGMHVALHPVGYPRQTEIVHCFNEVFRPVRITDLTTQPAASVLTLSPGKVLRDGVAAPRALTDADQTIYWYQGKHRTIPVSAANRTLYLDDTIDTNADPHPYDGAVLQVSRKSAADAFTWTVKNGPSGGGGQTIDTFPASTARSKNYQYAVNIAQVSGNPNLTFNAAGHTVTRSAGSYVTDGFEVGDLVTVYAFLNRWSGRVTALTATVMTLSGTAVIDEGPLGSVPVYASRWIVAP